MERRAVFFVSKKSLTMQLKTIDKRRIMWYNIRVRGTRVLRAGGLRMKVKVFCINRGTSAQYFGLKNAEENSVLRFTPRWKTEAGAVRWAERNGLKVVR